MFVPNSVPFEDLRGSLTSTSFKHALSGGVALTLAPLLNLPEERAIVQIKKGHSTLVVLDFSASTGKGLGSITYILFAVRPKAMPMEDYLRPTRPRSGDWNAQARSFVASNGAEYTWSAHSESEQEAPTFQCVTTRESLGVARYFFLPSAASNEGERPAAILEVSESHTNLLEELVATLIIMRYILRYPPRTYGVRL